MQAGDAGCAIPARFMQQPFLISAPVPDERPRLPFTADRLGRRQGGNPGSEKCSKRIAVTARPPYDLDMSNENCTKPFARILNLFNRVERVFFVALLTMMALAIFLAIIELAVVLGAELMKPPRFLLDITKLLDVFGFFLIVLIGIELLHSVKAYLVEDALHVEVILLVAMIAVARKVVLLDLKTTPSEMLYGIAALVVALASGYYLVRYARRPGGRELPGANGKEA